MEVPFSNTFFMNHLSSFHPRINKTNKPISNNVANNPTIIKVLSNKKTQEPIKAKIIKTKAINPPVFLNFHKYLAAKKYIPANDK